MEPANPVPIPAAYECPLCGAPLFAGPQRCPACGLHLDGGPGWPNPFLGSALGLLAIVFAVLYIAALVAAIVAR